jgi:four helix bundle protein
MNTNSPIYLKSYDFALRIVSLSKILLGKREYVISNQLLRSGTSIGANVFEASAAQSKKEFVAKMSIASKEARETFYWLSILKDSQIIDYNFNNLFEDFEELNKILTSIVKSAQENL